MVAAGVAADPQLAAARVVDGPGDRAGGDLELVERRDRLGTARERRADPGGLGGVQARELDHDDPDARALGAQLAAQAVGEAADRVLGRVVGRLQRDAAVVERGTDLYNYPVSRGRMWRSAACVP